MGEPRADATQLLVGERIPAAAAGGKGASLDRLIALGAPVPPTGVITTAAYRRFVREGGLEPLLRELVEGPTPPLAAHAESAARVDAAFLAAPMAPDLADSIRSLATDVARCATEMGLPSTVAVRSSAVAEDLAAASFAGQYRSFLDVAPSGPELLDAVRLTWASLWHPPPRIYRRFRHIPEHDLAMAVIVMAMLAPTEAGVVFTIDPAGSPDRIRIETVRGLGEELVSGATTPEVRLVDRVPTGDAPGTAATDELARLAMRVEEAFGGPQDIEWAGEGPRLWLIQARPITTVPGVDSSDDGFDSDPDPTATYTVAGITEMLSGHLPPLRWADAARPVEDGFRRLFDDLHGDPGSAGGRPLLARFRGRAALDLDQLEQLVAGVPGGSAAEVRSQYLGTEPPPTTPSRRAGPVQGTRTIGARWRAALEGEIVARAADLLVDEEPSPSTLASLASDALCARRRRILDLVSRGAAAEMAISAMATAAYRNVERELAKRLASPDAAALTQRLSAGHQRSPLRRWLDAHEPPDALDIGALDWDRAQGVLHDSASGRRFLEDLSDMARGMGSISICGGPTWDEHPELVWRSLQAAHRAPHAPPTTPTTELPHGIHRRFLRHEAADAAELLDRRERTKAAVLRLGGLLRRVELELGRRLVEADVLPDAVEIELLADGEIEDALAGAAPTPATLVRRRHALAAARADGPLPLVFTGAPTTARTPTAHGDRFHGWGASPGYIDGPPRLVHDPATAGLHQGEIIVARRTDPSWAPLFLDAGALVVEEGGPLSHAAIVARELGLPAVMNVPGVVDRLARAVGPVTMSVDGSAGLVVIHEHRRAVDPIPGPALVAPRAPANLEDSSGRLGVFVTGLMGAGVLLTLAMATIDAVHSARGRRRLGTRAARIAPAVAAAVGYGIADARRRPGVVPTRGGLAALGAALVTLTILAGVLFARAAGAADDLGGALLAGLSFTSVVPLGVTAAMALRSVARWPRVSPLLWPWIRPPAEPAPSALRRPWLPIAVLAGIVTALALLALLAEGVLMHLDEPIARALDNQGDRWIDLGPAEMLGRTRVALITAVLLALLGLRCRVWAIGFPSVVAAGGLINWLGAEVVVRERPEWSRYPGWTDSFPAGHALQFTILLTAVPLAAMVMGRSERTQQVLRLASLAILALVIFAHAQGGAHWPTDELAGVLIGLALTLSLKRLLEKPTSHANCTRCPWARQRAADLGRTSS